LLSLANPSVAYLLWSWTLPLCPLKMKKINESQVYSFCFLGWGFCLLWLEV
jgi:hypothetical protein